MYLQATKYESPFQNVSEPNWRRKKAIKLSLEVGTYIVPWPYLKAQIKMASTY